MIEIFINKTHNIVINISWSHIFHSVLIIVSEVPMAKTKWIGTYPAAQNVRYWTWVDVLKSLKNSTSSLPFEVLSAPPSTTSFTQRCLCNTHETLISDPTLISLYVNRESLIVVYTSETLVSYSCFYLSVVGFILEVYSLSSELTLQINCDNYTCI
jgi:hypothetical protein